LGFRINPPLPILFIKGDRGMGSMIWFFLVLFSCREAPHRKTLQQEPAAVHGVEKTEEEPRLFLAGDGEGMISMTSAYQADLDDDGKTGFALTEEKTFDDIKKTVEENKVLIGSVIASLGVVAAGGFVIKKGPKIKQEMEQMAVMTGLSKDIKLKRKVYIAQHTKNLLKKDTPGSFYTEITGKNGGWGASGKGRLILGGHPDEGTLRNAADKMGVKYEDMSIFAVVEKEFEFDSFPYVDGSGKQQTFQSYGSYDSASSKVTAPQGGAFKNTSVPDYRAVDLDEIDVGADWIKAQMDAGKVTYVHCKSGKGRSATMVAAYLMKYEGYSLDGAVALIKGQRPQVSINKKLFGEHYPRLEEYREFIRPKANPEAP
jgi:hypothetical protein